ncbi:MAG: polyribonucleotide nucleotidyltransferase [Armatimonadetes bacterium]|nr:polyribonucleotide nucleotidyltransferase [Armatimonadota bacterium]
MFDIQSVTVDFAGRPLTLETGQLARQASAAVKCTYGETVVLATVVCDDEPNPTANFLPLRVDFEEKMYAVGRIPGGFFKREGRPGEDATLICRKIDRPIRPLVPKGLRNELQVIATALSAENENAVDVVAMIASAAAMHISQVPFEGPFAAAAVAWLDEEFIVNPSFEQREEARMDLLVAAGPMGVLQVELGGDQVPEDIVLQGIEMASEACQVVCDAMDELREKAGKPKQDYPLWQPAPEVEEAVLARADDIGQAIKAADKAQRAAALAPITEEIAQQFDPEQYPDIHAQIGEVLEKVMRTEMRKLLLSEKVRVDGRAPDEIRPLYTEVGLLPRTHGSALFTRGETQVLSLTTLGATRDQKLVRSLEQEEYSRFMHHYNFPPFCTGEAKPLRGASRREIGHGALVSRSLEKMLPPEEEFPYTIRVVSEVLESNGSSSMASTCASSMSLMDAGVPIKAAVAGISVGLVYESEDNYLLLTDIQGLEDAAGDMDFKVTGTSEGVNGLHLDIKVMGVPSKVLAEGLERARQARLAILEVMNETISGARPELSKYAPRMLTVQVPKEAIGMVIGPGGKNIRRMEDEYEVKIDIEDEGLVLIFGENADGCEKARQEIRDLTREIEVGEVFTGKVVTITDFGAFVEVLPGRDGLLHISDIENKRTDRVEDVLKVGDEVKVKVIEVEPGGKIKLSRKALLEKEREGGGNGGGRRGGGRGGRDRKGGHGGRSHGRDRKGGNKSGGDDDVPPAAGAYFRDKKKG